MKEPGYFRILPNSFDCICLAKSEASLCMPFCSMAANPHVERVFKRLRDCARCEVQNCRLVRVTAIWTVLLSRNVDRMLRDEAIFAQGGFLAPLENES